MIVDPADVLGIDIGGVIIDAVREDGECGLDPPAIVGAFAAIARLHRERFSAGCWLVSQCKNEMEPIIMNWLERHGFFDATGIDRQRVVFCRESWEKAEICGEREVTHFIDDRIAVLNHMSTVVPNLYRFLSRASESEAMDGVVEGIRTIRAWIELTDELLDSGAHSQPVNSSVKRSARRR